MKCQRCHNTATLHITEVLSDEQFEELHLCEQCAHKYLYEPQAKSPSSKSGSMAEKSAEGEDAAALNQQQCPQCGISFVEFRNTGRLGCPHDYQEFRAELVPLLENIHGEAKHCGKTPRRLPQTKQTQTELMQLRNRLKGAITREDYEEAARIRDRIKELEES
jgi:protein arginine kinase activator